MSRYQLGIIGAYFTQFLKMRLAYRVDFFVDLVANLFAVGAQLAVLGALFGKIEALQGWTYHQVLFIYGFSLLPLGLFNLVSGNLYGFAEKYIAEGNLDRVLLRPVNPLAQVVFESFNISGMNEIILGVGIMVYAGTGLGRVWTAPDILAVLVLAPAAALVYVGVFLGLTCVSFWSEDRLGLAPPVYNVIRFSRYPLTIYSRWVQIFLMFVLPFAWVAFFPATWFVGAPEFRRLAVFTPLVGLTVFGLAYLLWSRGLRRYGSTGS